MGTVLAVLVAVWTIIYTYHPKITQTMKKTALLAIAITLFNAAAFSQKYKNASDTMKLNKEYASVLKDVSNLTSKLHSAQSDLPNQQSKAAETARDAEKASQESNDHSSSPDVDETKKAKKKADKAHKEARNKEKAERRVRDQEKKIAELTEDLAKKQQKLQELEAMRTAIRSGQ